MKRNQPTRSHLRSAKLSSKLLRVLSEKDLMKAVGGGGKDNLGPGLSKGDGRVG